jgi:anti-anti-sigma regulatory factor
MRSSSRSPRTRPSSRPAVGLRPRSERVDHRVAARAAVALYAGQPGLSVDVREDARGPVVTVAGELDLAGAGLVTAMLDHVRRRQSVPGRAVGRRDQVDVDLAGVTFVDSSGLAAVVDGRTRIVAASEPVRRLRRLLEDVRRADPYAASA